VSRLLCGRRRAAASGRVGLLCGPEAAQVQLLKARSDP
jgi:hypothetical protein